MTNSMTPTHILKMRLAPDESIYQKQLKTITFIKYTLPSLQVSTTYVFDSSQQSTKVHFYNLFGWFKVGKNCLLHKENIHI